MQAKKAASCHSRHRPLLTFLYPPTTCTTPQDVHTTHLGHAGGCVGAGEEGGLWQAPAGHQQVDAGVQTAQQEVADKGDVLPASCLCTGSVGVTR